MREIKFRVFNKKTKVMIMNVQSLYDGLGVYYDEKNDPIKNLYEQLPVDSFGEVLIAVENGGAHYDGDWELDLMQYTGLKGMYESDIIGDNVGIGVIEYVEKHAAFRVNYFGNTQAKWFYDYLDSELKTIEIIGNIHQNPELLEKHETQ